MASPQEFTLYAHEGRIYAENSAGKLIDIGAVRKNGNAWNFRLDVDGVTGEPAGSIEAALADVPGRISFLYLDGQFTALPDARDRVPLHDAPRHRIRLEDTVDLPAQSGGDTPHVF